MSQPIRMCIVCRERALQKELQRLQMIDNELVAYTHTGRSFYICKTCIQDNEKKVIKILNHKCKTRHNALSEFGKIFKETVSNG